MGILLDTVSTSPVLMPSSSRLESCSSSQSARQSVGKSFMAKAFCASAAKWKT